ILEINKSKSIKDFVIEKLKNDLSIKGYFLYLSDVAPCKEEIFQSPRIGLTLKKKDNWDLRLKYISCLYRYLIYPSKISKGKKMVAVIAMNQKPNIDVNKYF